MSSVIRRVITIVLSCAMVIAVASCGASGDEPGAGTTTTKQGEQTTADDGDNGDTEKTKITFQTWNPDEPAFQKLLEDMDGKLSDVEVELVFIPYSDHISKLKVDLASGEGPDVFGLQTGASMQEFSEFLTDLDPLAKEAWGDDWTSNYVDFAMEQIKGKLDSYFGLPLGMSYAGMIWANDFYFNKYDLEMPKSYDDLKKVSADLRAEGEYPLASGAKDDWINIDMFMNIVNDINPEIVYQAIEGEASWQDEDIIAAFSLWQSLFTDGIYQDGALGVNMYNDTTDIFEKEASVPMITNGCWVIGNYAKETEEFVKIWSDDNNDHNFNVISMDWNNDGTPAPVTAAVDVVVVQNKNSKNPEAAWKFMEYMGTDGADILVNDLLFYFPAKANASFTGSLSEEGTANYNKLMEISANVAGYREMSYPELKQAFADQLKALATEDATPEQAAEAIQAVSDTTTR